MRFNGEIEPKKATIDAVITRADGTQVNLGVVDAHYKNPIKQLWWDKIGKRRSSNRIKQANEALQGQET